MAQSQVNFKRVPEKVPKVPEKVPKVPGKVQRFQRRFQRFQRRFKGPVKVPFDSVQEKWKRMHITISSACPAFSRPAAHRLFQDFIDSCKAETTRMLPRRAWGLDREHPQTRTRLGFGPG